MGGVKAKIYFSTSKPGGTASAYIIYKNANGLCVRLG